MRITGRCRRGIITLNAPDRKQSGCLNQSPYVFGCALPFLGKLGRMVVVEKVIVDGSKGERRKEFLPRVGRCLRRGQYGRSRLRMLMIKG